MTPRLTPLAALIALAFPALAAADTSLALDAVVVTGSRVEHSSFDLPAAVDVVDAAKIGNAQARVNASEALAAVPGINVQNRQNYAQDLQISSRGFGARSAFGVRGIRLIADGIPASMPDGQGQAATFNLDRAERIEIMRGPLSSIYGNHAGGVIQMFTPEGKGRPSVEGSFSAGSYGSWKADVSAQGESGGLSYVIDASRFSTDGYREHSSAVRDQAMAKLVFHPVDDGKLTLIANTFKQDAEDPQGLNWADYQRNPSGVAAPALSFNTRKFIEHTQGGLNYEHRLGEHVLQMSAYAGQRTTTQYQSIPVGPQANPRHSGGVIDFDRSFAGLSGRWIGRFDLAGGRLTTTVGAEYEQSKDDRRGFENFIGATLGVMGNLRRKENDSVSSFDQYAQLEWQGERWTFTGGLRHSQLRFKVKDEYLSNGDDSGNVSYEKTTPMGAVMYRLSDGVNLYASAARGFETPTFNEMFYSSGGGAFNFSLKPSNSTHYEGGVKAMLGDASRLDLSLFQIKTDNEMVVLSSLGGRTAYQNAGPTTRRGAELAVDSQWQHNLTSRVAYTLLDARYDESFTASGSTVNAGNRLPGISKQALYGELAWKHPATGFHAGIEGIARSKVQVEDTNTAQAAPGYAIANLRLGIERPIGQTTVGGFFRLNNLFDRQYVGSVIVSEGNAKYYESAPGRNWLAGVTVKHSF